LFNFFSQFRKSNTPHMTTKKIIFLSFLGIFFIVHLPAQVIIDWNSQWSFFKGINDPVQTDTSWKNLEFDSAQWPKGYAPFWYGDGYGGTQLTDMQENYSALYIRNEFWLDDTTSIDELKISVDYDDGFVLWINGKLILQKNAHQNYSYNQFVPENHESGTIETYTFLKNELNLVNGINIIALQGFNASFSSSDFHLNARIEGIKRLPETDQVNINIPSGFYAQNFSVLINSLQTGDTIRYTLDGSDPRYSTKYIHATAPVNVLIDPNSNLAGRGKTGGVVLRASKFKTGFDPGKPVTRNYIFIEKVIAQGQPGGSWPSFNVNGQVLDYPMDTRVTSNPSYSSLMDDALLDIPTISVTTDPDHLFHSQTGIYVNAKYRGSAWERPANIELIYPDGTPGFNIDAGIRIRGGWSRHPEFAKHAFRIFFRSDYGEGRLRYPLFGKEGTDRFDKIDLRTSQNYSWSKGGWEGQHNTMNRDVFSRDTQGAMGQPYTRSRYYHLYLNGLYWGIFQTQERAEASFAASYLGGKSEDYDVVKVDVGDDWNLYEIEATDGTTDAWYEVWQLCQQGFSSNTNYFKLAGKKLSGETDTTMKVLVDIDNLIDYMLIIFYGGNFDSPVSKFSGDRNPNNFFAIYNRANLRDGFKFLVHDAEHSLLPDAVNPGSGLYENRVNIGSTGQMNVTSFSKFHPQWLHHKLTANKEYRLRFADRVHLHFHQNGVFQPDSSKNRFRRTSDQLNLAIIAESARWGDMYVGNPRTKNDDWLPAVNNVLNNFFPYRTAIVLNQLADENLHIANLKPPVVKKDGTILHRSSVSVDEKVTVLIQNPNTNGTIYYTLNGTDPRAVGGSLSGSALSAGNSASIEVFPGSTLKSRILNSSEWSALQEIYFSDGSLLSKLKITELHYHPADQGFVDGKDLEFIELKNIGTRTLDISGIAFTEGIAFTFPQGTYLSPKEFTVIASNKEAFTEFYAFMPDFAFTGNLSNSGEKIVLSSSRNDTIFSFTYSDKLPWPVEADGVGYSLVSSETNPTGDPGSHLYWVRSKNKYGSPFKDDDSSLISSIPVSPDVESNINMKLFPNPAGSDIRINFTLDRSEMVELSLYDLNGRLISLLNHEFMPAGSHQKEAHLESLGIGAGVYVVVARSNSFFSTRKLIYQD
jgi:hypothetical protein